MENTVRTSGVAAATGGPLRPAVLVTSLRPLVLSALEGPVLSAVEGLAFTKPGTKLPLVPAEVEGSASFLAETASQTETAVTYRKQTTTHFLTETRIAHNRLAARLSKSTSCAVFPSRRLSLIELIEGSKL